MNHSDAAMPEKHEADLLMAMTGGMMRSVDRIAAAVAGLSPEMRLAVSGLCKRFEIQGLSEVRILAVLCELMDFKRTREAVARTPKERAADLLAVATASRSLFDAIARLSMRDSFNLHMGAIDIAETWPEGVPEKVIPTPTAAQLETVGVVAQVLAGCMDSAAAPGGSRPTREVHAANIAQIWRAFRDSGVKPRRGSGGFEGFCNEVFALAGVPSAARGAIKLFNEKFLPAMRQKSAVGDAFEAAIDTSMRELMGKIEAEERRKNPDAKRPS